mmetsp:Transcript_24292/g.61570  ORF Transcript_24292/g.61570 Transcript_24292/m.61570 type:complete len:392 (-) Transcript_24292:64-1239(-)
MLPPALLRAWLPVLVLASATARPITVRRQPATVHEAGSQSWGGDPWFTKSGRRKQFVLACNGFADSRPAFVGVRTEDHIGAEAEAATLHLPLHERGGLAHLLRPRASLAQRRQRLRRGSLIPELAKGGGAHSWALRKKGGESGGRGGDSFWAKPLQYGACEEYHVDLTSRRMFFVTPEKGSCLLSGDAVTAQEEASDDFSQRFVVVLTQRARNSSDCAVVVMGLDRGPGAGAAEIAGGGGGVAAELAAIDAFTQEHPLVPYNDMEEPVDDEDEEDAGADLALGAGAVLRLEDVVDKQSITTEVVASRTLGLGQVYDVEPKALHVILEDLRGSKMADEHDVTFEQDRTYVAIRLGRAGDTAFPEKLALIQLSQSAVPPEDPPTDASSDADED